MKKIKIVLMIVGSIFIVSCESNTYSELTVVNANPTYAANIAPIMASNCVSCHSAGGTSPALATYDQVKAATATGNVICRIDQTCGSVMPPNGAMTTGTINTIKLWQQQGFVN
jgi:mono/diheme cytochrome c family protein